MNNKASGLKLMRSSLFFTVFLNYYFNHKIHLIYLMEKKSKANEVLYLILLDTYLEVVLEVQ